MSGLRHAFQSYKEGDKNKEAASLDSEIRDRGPFLTSSEQDKLVGQLRKERFFDKMKWDGGNTRWVSIKANI